MTDLESNFGCVGELLIYGCGLPVMAVVWPLTSRSIGVASGIATSAIVIIPLLLYSQRKTNKTLAAWLKEHCVDGRFNVCLDCQYDLTGNISDKCPECGAPVAVIID